MKMKLMTRTTIVAAMALVALAAATVSDAEARMIRGAGVSSHGPVIDAGIGNGTGRSHIMGPHGNGPTVETTTPKWRNNQGGLLGGMWPPPKRHPCQQPGRPPSYGC